MATTTVEFDCPAGQTLTLTVSAFGSNATPLASVAATERTNDTGRYVATIVDIPTGTYAAAARLASGVPIARGILDHTDAAGNEIVSVPATGQDIGGANTITVTVTDENTAPIQGASVIIKSGTRLVDSGTTNSSGVAVVTADDGTYTLVACYPTLYQSKSQSVVVDGDEAIAVELASLAVTPSVLPDQATGYLITYDEDGEAESGVAIEVRQTESAEQSGYAFDTKLRSVVSDQNGLVTVPGMWRGATYQVRRGIGVWVNCVVPDAPTFALPVVLGSA